MCSQVISQLKTSTYLPMARASGCVVALVLSLLLLSFFAYPCISCLQLFFFLILRQSRSLMRSYFTFTVAFESFTETFESDSVDFLALGFIFPSVSCIHALKTPIAKIETPRVCSISGVNGHANRFDLRQAAVNTNPIPHVPCAVFV